MWFDGDKHQVFGCRDKEKVWKEKYLFGLESYGFFPRLK